MAELITDPAAAAARLAAGEPVAFPTETVYGLGARADHDGAIARVYELKGRPADHPLILHLADAAQIPDWAQDPPPEAVELMERHSPGPLTLVLRRRPGRAERASGGRDTVALRVPAHPVARDLLERVGVALAAPSANRFGRPSPTLPEHVLREFAGEDLAVFAGGPAEFGIESSVVDLCDPARPLLLRPGALPRARIEEVTGALGAPEREGGAPGTLASHYAPRQPLRLLDPEDYAAAGGKGTAALGFTKPEGVRIDLWRRLPERPEAAARELFALLRALEDSGAARIVAELPPEGPEWEAVRDRLVRASAERG